MKRSRFTQEQIIGVLKEHQAGAMARDLCRKHGVSEATFFRARPFLRNAPEGGGERRMRKVSMATRTELVEAVGERYRSADKRGKGQVLDEFAAVTGLHRKHVMRLLRAKRGEKARGAERRVYNEAVRTALVVLWEAADRLCGKRLRPLIPILLKPTWYRIAARWRREASPGRSR